MVNRKIVGGVILIVVVAVIAVWFLVGAPARNPADVVLKASDLPAGYSIYYEKPLSPTEKFNYKLDASLQEYGFEAGYTRVFANDSNPNITISSRAIRFSSAEGAKNPDDDYMALPSTTDDENAISHSTIGNQSYVARNPYDCFGIFRKQNFIVCNGYEPGSYFSDSEVINHLQIVADRL